MVNLKCHKVGSNGFYLDIISLCRLKPQINHQGLSSGFTEKYKCRLESLNEPDGKF